MIISCEKMEWHSVRQSFYEYIKLFELNKQDLEHIQQAESYGWKLEKFEVNGYGYIFDKQTKLTQNVGYIDWKNQIMVTFKSSNTEYKYIFDLKYKSSNHKWLENRSIENQFREKFFEELNKNK